MSEINSAGGLSSSENLPKGRYKGTASGANMSDSSKIRSRSGAIPVNRKPATGVSGYTGISKAPAPSSDKVELSTGARLLEALGGELEQLQDVDTAKVEEVQEAIRLGKMPVDHQLLANRMQALFSKLSAESDSSQKN